MNITSKMKDCFKKNSNVLNITGNFIYKYRFIISIVIFILCVFFEISGSSIGCWSNFINSGIGSDTYLLYGNPRGIRSDEWAVFTPMMFSQCLNGFKYFSEAIRADVIDVFMIYGLPTLNLMQIFRPFQIGFLFLGISKGLSFFWIGRTIALILVTFEFAMILTKKDKILSLIGTLLVTFSPQVQWWFAINGTAELFIFGELALVLLYKYMNSDNLYKRALYLLFLVICSGGYILILYPAWQIPLFYVFLALAIWILVDNIKNCKINYKDIISIIIALIIFTSCMGYIFMKSYDTIKIITETVYPGSRVSLGGKNAYKYFSYPMNIFLPEKDVDLKTNTSEDSVMFGLFPIGLIISIYAMIKNKKIDLSLILLMISYIFLSAYCIFGFPKIIAKITLMSNSPSARAYIAIGFLDILILLRGIAITEKSPKIWVSILITILAGSFIAIGCKLEFRKYISKIMALEMCLMIVWLFYFALRYKSKYCKYFLLVGIIVTMFFAGVRVTPIFKGTDIIYDSPIIQEIQKINSNDSGNWIVESIGFPIANYVLMAGVPVINSTNTYPDLDRWAMLDPTGEYEDVYNRYAHITMNIVTSSNDYENKFILTYSDQFTVNVTPEDLESLDVKYIFSIRELENYNTEDIKYELLYDYNAYRIYKVSY